MRFKIVSPDEDQSPEKPIHISLGYDSHGDVELRIDGILVGWILDDGPGDNIAGVLALVPLDDADAQQLTALGFKTQTSQSDETYLKHRRA